MTENWTHPTNQLSELKEWRAVIWKCRFDSDEYFEMQIISIYLCTI